MQPLADLIRTEIAAVGAVSFARFMELALYHPVHGYYEKPGTQLGRRGDFYTGVCVGPVFGQLLAVQFARWARTLPTAAPVILEAGAHDGALARDILQTLARLEPDRARAWTYCLLEPSPRRQAWQQETLRAFGAQIRWCRTFDELPARALTGILFAHELLDAFPVHRLGWDARQRAWFEWGVTWRNDRFDWVRWRWLAPSTSTASAVPNRERGRAGTSDRADGDPGSFPNVECRDMTPQIPAEGLAVLPDGFTTEVCPAATAWWRQAAHTLGRGWLFTGDYGWEREAFGNPARAGGTARAFYRHHPSSDLLTRVGEQDLTAHVDFTALREAGEAAGLRTVRRGAQAPFLVEILRATEADPDIKFDWTPERVRQFQTLIHPDHLGRSFQVLVQERAPAE